MASKSGFAAILLILALFSGFAPMTHADGGGLGNAMDPDGGGIGNGGSFIKQEFMRVADRFRRFRKVEAFGPRWSKALLAKALDDANVRVVSASVSTDSGANAPFADVTPILLDEQTWLTWIFSGESLGLPVCQSILTSMGIDDQTARCEKFLQDHPSVFFSIAPVRETVQEELVKVLAPGAVLPGECSVQKIAAEQGTALRFKQGWVTQDLALSSLDRITVEDTLSGATQIRTIRDLSGKSDFMLVYRPPTGKIVRVASRNRANGTWIDCDDKSMSGDRPETLSDPVLVERHFVEQLQELKRDSRFIKALGVESPTAVQALQRLDSVEVSLKTLVDRYGSAVHAKVEDRADGVLPKRILVAESLWAKWIRSHRNVALLVCHEVARAVGVDDDEFRFCASQIPSTGVELRESLVHLVGYLMKESGCEIPGSISGDLQIASREDRWRNADLMNRSYGTSFDRMSSDSRIQLRAPGTGLRIELDVRFWKIRSGYADDVLRPQVISAKVVDERSGDTKECL